MSNSVAATDYAGMRKAQLIEKLQGLEREVARLAQTGAAATATGASSNDEDERLRDFAEIASDWFWETDEQLRFTYFSGRHGDVGLDTKRPLGKTRLEVTIEDTAQKKWIDHQADLVARKPFKDFRYASHARDGRILQLSVSGKAIFDEAGNFKGYRGTGTDITALIESEAELQRSEAQIRGIMDNAPIEIVLKDTEGRYVLTNAQWRKNYNLTDNQATGRTPYDFFPEEFAQPISVHEREVMATGVAVTHENNFPESNGLRDFLTITFPIRDMTGDIINIGAIAVDITERKRADAALQESEARFRDIAQASGDWFWETDADHRFTWLSDRAEELTGVPVRFHIGKSRLELAADQVEQGKWRAHLDSLEARQPFRDFRYLRRGHDGRLQHMSSNGVPVFDAENSFKGYRGVGADISAEVRSEEMIASAQERFMAAIESVSDGFALFDADDRMVFCNSRFKKQNPDLAPKLVPGISFEEMLRDNVAANRILNTLDDDETFIRRRMEQHRNLSGPLVQRRRDGRWLELREERTPEGGTFLVNTDITERKRAEELVIESEARLSKAAEMAKIGYWLWDEIEDKAIHCSEELAKMHGVDSGDELVAILSSHAADLEQIHPDDRERYSQTVEKSQATKDGFDIEYRIIGSEGEIRHVHVIEELIVDQHGTIVQSNGVAHDITDQKLVEEEIRNLNAELEQRVEERTEELRAAQAGLLRQERMATLGQLTATVSHELRNPLGTIRASVYILRNGFKEAEPVIQRSLERIERSTIRCDRIIEELLDFTRISELETEPASVDAWLEETLNEQELPSEITQRRDFGLGDMTVPLDKDRFRRAIINVFDNASQAMIGSGTKDEITGECILTVRTQSRNDRIEIVFEDTGPGIPPDVYERIFEPLYSTKGFGVGLGLPVVKQIMEQHDGGIEIESEEGKGTRVCLWLPRGRVTH